MKAYQHQFALWLLLLASLVLAGCPGNVKPETPLQAVYVAKQSLVVYGTWIVAENGAGRLTGDKYERAKAVYEGARASLDDARDAAVQNDTDAFLVAMTAANKALEELAIYKGDKP